MTATNRTPPPARARTDAERPDWFRAFLTDRATRKPSPHTMQAYRQDFDAIAALVADDPQQIAALTPPNITKDSMRQAFAAYAESHEASSIRRCWSTWNTLCSYLFTADLLPANPMQLVGRPKPAKTLPKSLPQSAAQALLNSIDTPAAVKRSTDWPERDRAVILTALLAGLRAQELRGANVGDLRVTEDRGGVLHVRGKGNKDRTVPIEAALIAVLTAYLASRAARFPATPRRRAGGVELSRWPANAPLFVGHDGHRITRGALQYRVLRAFKLAGPDAQRTPGALVHALRHTYATELANTNISVYKLMKLLGHESMATSQRYVISAGSETRAAAAQNPLYGLASDPGATDRSGSG
jgi:integrase/recombinase XerC